MRSLTFLVAATVAAFAVPAHAAPPVAVPKLEFEKYTLPNGLQVILHVDKKLPIVHVNLWYHVGSKNERPGRTGFAHLFEHMMLQGSKNVPTDYFTTLQRIGARSGRDSNGTTWSDRTSYFSTAPSGALEFMLYVHSDLLATLPEALTQQKLDNQREVVRNERRQRIENAPYGRVVAVQPEAMYGKGHPYSWPVIGFHEDLMAASLDDVKQFFRTFYAPNNLSLAITGDFDPKNAKELVAKYFGGIPPGPPLERPTRMPVTFTARKEVDFNDRVAQERLYLYWPSPGIGEDGDIELGLAGQILSEGLSSRLQKALIYDAKLCTGVNAGQDPSELTGEFFVVATARPGVALADIERVIDRELSRLARQGPTAAEVARARSVTLTNIINGMQDIGAFGGKGDVLNRYNVFFGDPAKFEADLAHLQRVTAADVKRAAARWIDSPNRLVIRVHPETSARPTVADVDRTRAPALAADAPFKAPAVSSTTLANGLELHVIERPELPIVTAALVARAGSAADPRGKDGLAALTTTLMKRGVRGKSALALEEAFADLGVDVVDETVRERAALILTAIESNVGPALTLLAQVAREPSFAEAELERERSLTVEAIARAEKDPAAIGNRLRDMLAFGAEHPFGHPANGYRRTVGAITRDDVVAFHAARWKPKGSALFIVGNLPLARAKALAEASFGAWSGTAPPPPAAPPPQAPHKGKILLVDRPDAAQTYVVQVFGAPPKRGDDYYGWRLAGEVLGAGASGRLYSNLRQDKGYSYGASSLQSLSSGTMGWFALGGVQTDKTKESVVEFVAEAKGLAGGRPIAAQEADEARVAWLRNYAAGFLTNDDVARRSADLWARGWPLSLLGDEAALFAKTTAADAQAAAKRYVVPAESTLLLVGDRGKIEAGVRSLKLGEVVILDIEGKPVGDK